MDTKLLTMLSAISTQQAKAIENTATAVNQLLDYITTHLSDGVMYHASNMVLAVHSNASYS